MDAETDWIRLERVNHGSNLIRDVSAEEQMNTMTHQLH